MKTTVGGRWRVFEKPDPNQLYILGVDTASGKENANDSTIQILSVHTGRQVAVAGGKYTPEDIAAMAYRAGYAYCYKDKRNPAEIAVEAEFHGASVIGRLLEQKYPNIYYHAFHSITFQSGANEYGWSARKYRQVAIDLLQTDIAWSLSKVAEERRRAIYISDPATRQQLIHFEQNKKSGRYEAKRGKFDDLVSALMIANFVRHERMGRIFDTVVDDKPRQMTHAEVIMAGTPKTGSREAGPRDLE